MYRFNPNATGFRSETISATNDGTNTIAQVGVFKTENVGPGQYSPRYRPVLRQSPAAGFSKGSRFDAHKNAYISKHHNHDLLSTCSPGPKYAYGVDTIKQKAPKYSMDWGEKKTDGEIAQDKANKLMVHNDVGPATYTPHLPFTLRHQHGTSFGRAKRFGRSVVGGDLTIEEDDLLQEPTNSKTIHRNFSNRIRRKAPEYSFPKSGATSKSRTWFLNHNVRGQLSHAATMDGAIGPSHYTPTLPGDHLLGARFGNSARFAKPGIEYISAKHCQNNVGVCSPGPKYNTKLFDIAHKKKTGRVNSWGWI